MFRLSRSLSNTWQKGRKLKKRDGPYPADDYILTPKNISADFLHSFDQNEHYNYNQKEEEEKGATKRR